MRNGEIGFGPGGTERASVVVPLGFSAASDKSTLIQFYSPPPPPPPLLSKALTGGHNEDNNSNPTITQKSNNSVCVSVFQRIDVRIRSQSMADQMNLQYQSKVWGHRDKLVFPMRTHTFINQMNLKNEYKIYVRMCYLLWFFLIKKKKLVCFCCFHK